MADGAHPGTSEVLANVGADMGGGAAEHVALEALGLQLAPCAGAAEHGGEQAMAEQGGQGSQTGTRHATDAGYQGGGAGLQLAPCAGAAQHGVEAMPRAAAKEEDAEE